MGLQLKQYLSRRMLVIFMLGFSSGLPLALVGSLLQAWFRVSGIDIVAVGFLSLVGQPYVYKFLWAPLLDRFRSPIFGFLDRRRGWILTSQVLIILTIILMASLQPKSNPWLIGFLGMVLAVISATQDIAVDAYKVEILPVKERGLGAALAIEGYRLAMIVGGGLGFVLAEYVGWQSTYIIMALLMLIGMVGVWLGEPSAVWQTTSNSNLSQEMFRSLKNFLSKDQAVWLLALIVLYKLGDAMSHSLSSAFLLDLGFSLTAIGTINKVVGLLATLIGVMFAGIIMTKINLFKTILFFGVLQGLTNLLYILLALSGKNYYLAVVVFFIENLCSGMGTSAFLAFLMSLCEKQHAATQFALLSSVSSFGRVYIGAVAGYLVKVFGWQLFYFWSALLSVPGIILILYLKPQIMFHDKRVQERREELVGLVPLTPDPLDAGEAKS